MKEKKEWRPLPDSITVKDSKIEGLGVFATKNISAPVIINLLILVILLFFLLTYSDLVPHMLSFLLNSC